MKASKALIDAVAHVLKIKAREGATTKHDAVTMVHGRIERLGGPTKFGIGAAAMRMALLQIIETEVSRQMKAQLTEHEYKFMLPAATPMEFIAALGRTPRWIAIGEGPDAIWKFALTATTEDWIANFRLKDKKAQQTRDRALDSKEIADFLMLHGFSCLAEALSKGV